MFFLCFNPWTMHKSCICVQYMWENLSFKSLLPKKTLFKRQKLSAKPKKGEERSYISKISSSNTSEIKSFYDTYYIYKKLIGLFILGFMTSTFVCFLV